MSSIILRNQVSTSINLRNRLVKSSSKLFRNYTSDLKIKRCHKESSNFGRLKSNPAWLEVMSALPIGVNTKIIELDAEMAGGIKSLLHLTINLENITAVTNNRDDYDGLLSYIRRNKLPCIAKREVLSKLISEDTEYSIIINDGMSTHYGSENEEYGYERTWANALKQQLPWLFIWNCMTLRLRARSGYSDQIGKTNMYALMKSMSENAGYTIRTYTEGKHPSTPKDSNPCTKNKFYANIRCSLMSNTSFYLVKVSQPVENFIEKNNKLINTMRYLRKEAPAAVWNI